MKLVAQVVIVTLLCLLPVLAKESLCTYGAFDDSHMCFSVANPIVWYPTTTEINMGKSNVDSVYPTVLGSYVNATTECISALQELVCTFFFKPCFLGESFDNDGVVCNSTSVKVENFCGVLPAPNSLEVDSYYSHVDDANPRCAFAFQPQCPARTVVHAGSYVSPYRVDNNYGINYNQSTVCDAFSYADDNSGNDMTCAEMPDFGSACPEGTSWNTWFRNLNTKEVKCKASTFTLENKRYGDPCLDNSECLSFNCSSNYCYENDFYCDGLYSCRPGMYCFSNNQCVPMRVENEACSATDLCAPPLTCVLGNCTRPAQLGEPCSNMSPGDSGEMNSPFCGPPINTIYDAFTTCAAGTCSHTIATTLGSSCYFNDGTCDPFISVCNATADIPIGQCVAPEQVSCKTHSGSCDANFQYCDCIGGAGTTGVCRVKQDHPLVACQNEHVQLYECLRTKCNAYNSKGQFYDLSFYPFDGYSCGNTQCMNETKNVYCCMVDVNGGIGLSNLSTICGTPTPTPTPTQTTTLEPTTSMAPTTTETPTTEAPTTAAPTTTAEPTTTAAPTTTIEPTTTASPTTVAPTTSTVTPTPVVPTTETPTTTAPTSTAAPATSAPTTTIPTTTTPPTTSTPTTSVPTTVAPTTGIPTTSAPIVTSTPVAIVTAGTLTATSSGDVAQIPIPVANNSVVLFTSANATSVVPLTFANTTELPKNAIIQRAQVTFTVTYIEQRVTVLITLTDEFGDIAGSIRTQITQNGTISVDISALYAQILAENQKDIQIRAIRGAILKVSLSVETTDVAVNLDKNSVTSNVIYTVAETPSPTSTTAPTVATIPLTTKPSLSHASTTLSSCFLLFICFLVFL